MDANENVRLMDAGATEIINYESNESSKRRVYHRPDGRYDIMVIDIGFDETIKMLQIAAGDKVNMVDMSKKPKWTLKNPLPFGSVFIMHNSPYDFYWISTGKTLVVGENGYSREELIWSDGCLAQPCDILGLPFIDYGMNDGMNVGEEYYTDKQLRPHHISSWFPPGEKVKIPYERHVGVNYTLVRRYKNGWIVKKYIEKPKKTWKFKCGDRVVWGGIDHGIIVACLDESVMSDGYTSDYKVCWDGNLNVEGAAEENLKLE